MRTRWSVRVASLFGVYKVKREACMCDHCAREATCEVGSVCEAPIDRTKWKTIKPRAIELRDGVEVCIGTMFPVGAFAPGNVTWLRNKISK